MKILSLGAGTCAVEKEIAKNNNGVNVVAVEGGIDPGKDNKYFCAKDIKDDKPENLELIENDYYSEEFINEFVENKGKVNLILLNFPHNDQLYFPEKEENVLLNKQMVENLSKLLLDGGKVIMTSDRCDQEKSMKSFCKAYTTPASYIPKAASFDYIKTIKEIADSIGGLNSEVVDGFLEKTSLNGKEVKLFINESVSFKSFKDYFEFKTLILEKIEK